MKRLSPNGFTLVEMIVVIAVLIILAAFTLTIARIVQHRANVARALDEIHAMQVYCDAYKNDNGSFPQNADTDAIDPRVDADPASPKYQKSSLHFYSCITGDFLPAGAPDGRPERGNTVYGTIPPRQLSVVRDSAGATTVRYIQDPFGSAYGYSTVGSQAEAAHRSALRASPTAARPTALRGYNPTFDLWSTGGGTKLQQQPKWLKNWAE